MQTTLLRGTGLARWSPQVLSLVRIVIGLLFLEHGMQKLFDFPAGGHHAALLTLSGLQAVIEFGGGILIALGLFTRPTAFILSGDMAAAYFMAHFPKSFFPVNNGGDGAILDRFLFLDFAFSGRGRRAPTNCSCRSAFAASRDCCYRSCRHGRIRVSNKYRRS